jgi:dihydrofolate reductase
MQTTLNAPKLAIIVAISRNGVIGRNGALPWHLPEDLQWFKKQTTGHAILMGRLTYQSIGRPLPNRRNIVVASSGFEAAGCEVFPSLESAIAAAHTSDPMPFVIGGRGLYAAALPLATRLVISHLDRVVEGDVLFPACDMTEWRATERIQAETSDLSFVVYERLLSQ